MKNLIISILSRLTIILILSGVSSAQEAGKFYAYFTNLPDSATSYMGADQDIIVVLGADEQVEFARRTGYLPIWHTKNGKYSFDNFYTNRDVDSTFKYSYVRLIKNSHKEIVVQWRFFPKIKPITEANKNLDPLVKLGLTGVVQELFKFYPNHKVERVIRDGSGTRYADWMNPKHATIQTIELTSDGIKSINIKRGEPGPFYPRKGVEGSVVKSAPLKAYRKWNFDEGMKDHEDYVTESVTRERCPIEGLMTVFKKGVSGTALAFDGNYTGVTMNKEQPRFKNEMTLTTWIALDVYPYNLAPIIHQSRDFAGYGNYPGRGYYLGVNAYGHVLFRVDGVTVRTYEKIPLHKWTSVVARVEEGKASIFINNKQVASTTFWGPIDVPKDVPVTIGLNTEKERGTDYVRGHAENLPYILGLRGLIDEIAIYNRALSNSELTRSYKTYLPKDRTSSLAKGKLPGELGKPKKFGAYYKTLSLNELWKKRWRLTDNADIVVKFKGLPTSVIFWHGTNYAPSWISDNNRWFADQSTESFYKHGCAEHMADKQLRHCRATIVENTPARVVIHWRYTAMDISYFYPDKRNWSDEYYTIYPDGSGIRKVVWNNKSVEEPGFEDVQFLTNPGESALDVMNLQAADVANLHGDIQKLTWKIPNGVPKVKIDTATIELLKSKSKNRVYIIFPGGSIGPWGTHEQSRYSKDPFAGPWNHWPAHLIPSDGRFAVDSDRVSHFATGGGDDFIPKSGGVVQYGFTEGSINNLLERARFWRNPPMISNVKGGEFEEFDRSQNAFLFRSNSGELQFIIDADSNHPVVNPAMVIKNWQKDREAIVTMNGKTIIPEKVGEGIVRDSEGKKMQVIWIKLTSVSPVVIDIK